MCSFLITSWLISNLTAVNFFLQRRGPDATQTLQKGGFTFVHNLLHMTGGRTLQPFVEDDIVALYNGELYNAQELPPGHKSSRNYASDGECLIPTYKQLGTSFPRALDGEWALLVFDFAEGLVVLSSDVFSTKPLWYSLYDGFHASSYKSPLLTLGLPGESLRMVNPNEVVVFRLEGIEAHPIAMHAVHEFDVRQFKTNTNDWQAAFRGAVRKRVVSSDRPTFISLSSGYDSGALHAALELEALEHSVHYFTVGAEELSEVLINRVRNHNQSISRSLRLQLSLTDFKSEVEFLRHFAEPFQYSNDNWAGNTVQEDGAAAGLSSIFRRCREAGILSYISGAGADEIISDYGFAGEKFFPHSSFGGMFPDDLHSAFPWRSVFLGTQRDYLMKEEIVAGSHGLEARYPFLDRTVVQEFLWLTSETKNAIYKRPVHDMLVASDYPFDKGRKDGFAASRNLKLSGPTEVEVLFDALSVLVPVDANVGSDLCCDTAALPEGLSWLQLRSLLVTFLTVPENDVNIVEYLGSRLLESIGSVHRLPTCAIGELCVRLLVLVLMDPHTRWAHMGEVLWAVLAQMRWEAVVRSGWPLFLLLLRLSTTDLPDAGHKAGLPLESLVPLTGCAGVASSDERELDAPLAVMVASGKPHFLSSSQDAIINFWGIRPLSEVLASARMCEAFAALEHHSRHFYRVNLADAWHLLP